MLVLAFFAVARQWSDYDTIPEYLYGVSREVILPTLGDECLDSPGGYVHLGEARLAPWMLVLRALHQSHGPPPWSPSPACCDACFLRFGTPSLRRLDASGVLRIGGTGAIAMECVLVSSGSPPCWFSVCCLETSSFTCTRLSACRILSFGYCCPSST